MPDTKSNKVLAVFSVFILSLNYFSNMNSESVVQDGIRRIFLNCSRSHYLPDFTQDASEALHASSVTRFSVGLLDDTLYYQIVNI